MLGEATVFVDHVREELAVYGVATWRGKTTNRAPGMRASVSRPPRHRMSGSFLPKWPESGHQVHGRLRARGPRTRR